MEYTKVQVDRFRSLFAGVDVGGAIDKDVFREFWGLGWLIQTRIEPLQRILTERGLHQLNGGSD